MMPFGDFTDASTLRLQRLLPAKPSTVWLYLTEPSKLASWLADVEIDLQLGGRVQLLMLDKNETRLEGHQQDAPKQAAGKSSSAPPASKYLSGKQPAGRPLIRGVITRCDPASMLAFTWRSVPPTYREDGTVEPESEVVFDLSAQGERTQMTLIHRRLSPGWLALVGCGWHLLLEDLASRLVARDPAPFMARFEALLPEYQKRAAPLLS